MTGEWLTETHLYTLQIRKMTRVHVLTRTVDRHGSRARPTNFHGHTSIGCPNSPLALLWLCCPMSRRALTLPIDEVHCGSG